jgi:Icc protein
MNPQGMLDPNSKKDCSKRGCCSFVLILSSFVLSCSQNIDFTPFGSRSFQALPTRKNDEAVSSILHQKPNCEEFDVGVIGDVHDDLRGFRKAIERINKVPVSFVVMAGDVVNLGLINEYSLFLEFAQSLKHPWFVVLGNHDSIGRGWEIFRELFGSDHFWFDYCNVRFVIWNSNTLEFGGSVPNFEFLEEATNHDRVVSLVHIPPDNTEFRRAEMVPMTYLSRKPILLSISGHEHGLCSRTVGNFHHITVERAKSGRFVRVRFTPTSYSVEVCGDSCVPF